MRDFFSRTMQYCTVQLYTIDSNPTRHYGDRQEEEEENLHGGIWKKYYDVLVIPDRPLFGKCKKKACAMNT
jgi:hypothetical protein